MPTLMRSSSTWGGQETKAKAGPPFPALGPQLQPEYHSPKTVSACEPLTHAAHRCCQNRVTTPVTTFQELPIARQIKSKFLTRLCGCLTHRNTSPSPMVHRPHRPLTSQAFSYLQALALAVSSAWHAFSTSLQMELLRNLWGPERSHLLREAVPQTALSRAVPPSPHSTLNVTCHHL